MYTIIGTSNFTDLHTHGMGYLYQQVCSIFKFESFNAYQKKAFHSIVNEKKDVFVNLTTGVSAVSLLS